MKRILFIAAAITLFASAYAGAQNLAVFLDGADFESFVSGPDHPCYHRDLGDEWTAEAWVKPGDAQGEQMILNKEDSWEFASGVGQLQTALAPAGQGWDWMHSGLPIAVNRWSHVAVSWDGQLTRMWVHGVEGDKSDKFAGNAIKETESTFKVGRRERGGDQHSIFNGMIDEARISVGVRYDGDYDVPETEFVDDADALAIYHFNEIVNGDQVENFAKLNPKACPNGTLEGAVEFVDAADAPFEPFAVQPEGKLTTTWGSVKGRSLR